MSSSAAAGGSGARPVSRSRSRSRSRANSYGGGDGGYDGMDSSGGYAPGEADFCNSFWGSGHTDDPGMERGYEALMGRVKQAGKTTEEFRQFFKERAAIEEEYAKKMAKLARMPLGRDETGEFGNILRRVQYEADQSGRCHNELANVIRQTLEARVKEFEASRDQRRRNTQIAVERSWKNRQQQEALVTKAQEKYKSDCILINSFSARLSLTQGRDMDKVTSKLEKAQQTVQVNEAEYKNYLKALKDTQTKWVGEWKAWCDLAQDLEEERIDFTRNALWSYVNAVSLICVKDDESCENVRQTVEMCDVRRDLQRFVQKEGGGNMITDPPTFTDFSDGDKGSFPPVSHPAKFSRSSAKVEQAPFDGLERLQAAIYPQQNGTAANASGRTGPKSVPVTPNVQTPAVTGGEERQRSHTPARESRTPAPTNGTDATPQAAARPASPIKKSQTPAPAPGPSQSQVPDARAMAAATSQPPPPPPAAFSAARSRPASRAGEREDAADSSSQTTAEVLQHKASQKRLSTAAGKTPGPPVSAAGPNPSAGSAPSPNYPYATPRTAKPFTPDSGPDLRESPSGILPPASVSSGGGPSVPTKPGDAPASSATEPQKPKEDPLLAALAKLRSPSSAVDVLPPTSPGIPGGVGAIGLPGMARSPQPHLQQQRAYSPYGQSQPQTQPGMDGRARSPSMPHVQQQQQPQGQYGQPQQRQPNMYPLPGQAPAHSQQQQQTYTRPMSASMSQPAHMGTSSSPAPTAASVYTQARSRPSSPNPQMQQQQQQQQHQGYQHPRAPSPSAAMMRPPSSAGGAAPSDVSLGSNVAGYGATFPGERRLSMSIAAPANAQPQQQSQSQSRPSSPAIRSPPQHGGTGFGPPQQGRASPAPGYGGQGQPMHPAQMRSPSPGPPSAAGYPAQQQQQQYAYAGQPAQQSGPPAGYGQQQARPQSAYQPAPQGVPGLAQGQGSLRGQGPGHRSTASYGGHASAPPPQSASAPLHQTQSMGGRPTTPLGGGISLDASGQVVSQDAQYGSQRAPQQQQQQYGGMTSPQQVQQQSAGYRHGASIYKQPSQSQNRISSPAPPQAQQQAMSPGGYGYVPQQQQQQQGGAPPQQQAQMYQRAASPYQQPPGTSPAPVQQQQQQQPGYQQGHSGIARSQSQSIGYGQQQPQQQPGMPYQPQQTLQASQSYRQHQPPPNSTGPAQTYASSPAQQQQQQHPSQQPLQAPPPSRAPTGQFTLSGHPILFAVKAIYKYDASSPEEFSFQKDDVIGVVETDEDGWWKGELLDPERARRSGGMLFPSNFTTFLD